MKMFNNITLYHFVGDVPLPEDLLKKPLRDLVFAERQTTGFISANDQFFKFGVNEKVVPPSTIKQETAKLVAEEAERTGKKVKKYREQEIKVAVTDDLVGRALTKLTEVDGYFADGYLIVNTSSIKICELIISAIRESLTSFVCEPIWTEKSPQHVLAEAMLGNNMLADCLAITDNVALFDLGTPATTVRTTSHPMDEDVLQHVRNGMQVQSISLDMNARLEFVLTNKLQVRSIKFTEFWKESEIIDGDERDDAADALLMKAEFKRLFEALDESFGLCK